MCLQQTMTVLSDNLDKEKSVKNCSASQSPFLFEKFGKRKANKGCMALTLQKQG